MSLNHSLLLLTEIQNYNNLYVSVSLSSKTVSHLNTIIELYKLPNAVSDKNFHISLFTSSKKPNIPFGFYKLDLELDDIKQITAMTWFSNKKEDPDKRLFVLEFTSFTLFKFRKHLINILNIPLSSIPLMTNKFHITLSYNVGSKKEFPITKDIIKPFPIEITGFKCQ